MRLQVVVPYLAAPWCLEDLLESFGASNVPVLVVDNSSESYCSDPRIPFPGNVEIVSHPENIGASAAWNLGLERGADQTLIVSQWVRFSPMEHSRRPASWGLNHIARGIEQRANAYGLTFGDQGYHLVCVGRRCVETIGTFDANLYFYGNDDDYIRRQDLAGFRHAIPDWGSSGAYSVTFGANKRGAHPVDAERTKVASDYYRRKWGPSFYDYTRPFNNPDNRLSYWPPVPE